MGGIGHEPQDLVSPEQSRKDCWHRFIGSPLSFSCRQSCASGEKESLRGRHFVPSHRWCRQICIAAAGTADDGARIADGCGIGEGGMKRGLEIGRDGFARQGLRKKIGPLAMAASSPFNSSIACYCSSTFSSPWLLSSPWVS